MRAVPLRPPPRPQGPRDKANEMIQGGAQGFYKVPFEEVPELVRTRKVFLRGGAAYVPVEQLSVLVTGAYRAGLSRALTLTARRRARPSRPRLR